jgi:hypothetical protein
MTLRFSALALLLIASCASPANSDGARSASSGLLANLGMENQPVEAVYFFAGEKRAHTHLFTTNPLDVRDTQWNSDPSSRPWVMDRMVSAHVNTVVMSYWSNATASSPLELDDTSLPGVLDAVTGRPLVIEPAIESSSLWRFADEFPLGANGEVAPGLVTRIGELVALFRGRMQLWAQIFDRNGEPRYAVNIIHASSNSPVNEAFPQDVMFANAFDVVAARVEQLYGIRIGFTLDAVANQPFSASPATTGAALERTASVLAIQDYEPEVFSGLVRSVAPCDLPSTKCPAPYDNNVDNLGNITDWKAKRTQDWIGTGVPVLLSVSNGFDGRYVWAKNGTGFWGDNHDYTDDRFRNWLSEMKGQGAKGISFDTWNGFNEGYAAVPSVEHGDTVYEWLTDTLHSDPRVCSHTHFEGGFPTFHLYGSICRKWVQLGGDRKYGAPVSDQILGERSHVVHFERGGEIFWSAKTGAHEVHGLIAQTYDDAGADASCLGLPIKNQEHLGAVGRISRFEHGTITWQPGEPRGRISCSG